MRYIWSVSTVTRWLLLLPWVSDLWTKWSGSTLCLDSVFQIESHLFCQRWRRVPKPKMKELVLLPPLSLSVLSCFISLRSLRRRLRRGVELTGFSGYYWSKARFELPLIRSLPYYLHPVQPSNDWTPCIIDFDYWLYLISVLLSNITADWFYAWVYLQLASHVMHCD